MEQLLVWAQPALSTASPSRVPHLPLYPVPQPQVPRRTLASKGSAGGARGWITPQVQPSLRAGGHTNPGSSCWLCRQRPLQLLTMVSSQPINLNPSQFILHASLWMGLSLFQGLPAISCMGCLPESLAAWVLPEATAAAGLIRHQNPGCSFQGTSGDHS